MAGLAALALLVTFDSQPSAAHSTPTPIVEISDSESEPGAPINRGEIIARAQWALTNHPSGYTHDATPWGPEADIPYTADCSGLVSMAWHLPRMASSASLPAVTTAIEISDLKPGDILDIPGTHVVIFAGWTETPGSFEYFTYGSYPPHQAIGNVENPILDGHPMSDYHALRYTQVVTEEAVDYVVAYDTDNELLVSDAFGVHRTTITTAEQTRPAVAVTTNRGWVVAANSNYGTLSLYSDGRKLETDLALRPGTSPAVAASPLGGFRVVYQHASGELWVFDGAMEAHSIGNAVAPDSNPAIAARPNGGYVMAYQSENGALIAVDDDGPHPTGIQMMPGSNPSIAAAGDGYRALAQDVTGALAQYDSRTGPSSLGNSIMLGTDPAITALPNGNYQAAVHAPTGELVLRGETNAETRIEVSATQSPQIATAFEGFRVAVIDPSGVSVQYDSATGLMGSGTNSDALAIAGVIPASDLATAQLPSGALIVPVLPDRPVQIPVPNPALEATRPREVSADPQIPTPDPPSNAPSGETTPADPTEPPGTPDPPDEPPTDPDSDEPPTNPPADSDEPTNPPADSEEATSDAKDPAAVPGTSEGGERVEPETASEPAVSTDNQV